MLRLQLPQILLVFFSIVSTQARNTHFEESQDTSKIKACKIHFELAENLGKTIANQPNFPKTQLSQITEFSLLRECHGAEAWHQYYNFPVNGITFFYGTSGNAAILGNYVGAMASFRHERNSQNKFRFRKKVGFGFAWFDKPYNSISNSANDVIGSRITAVANAQLACNYTLNPFLNLSAGASYFHFSNSHYQLPNLGLNAVFLNLGISYFPSKIDRNTFRRAMPELNKKLHLNLKIGLGINERGGTLGPTDGPKYPIYLISGFVTRNYKYNALLQAGVEANFNTGAYDYIRSNAIFDSNLKRKSSTAIFFLGHEYLWKHLSFVVQGGIYLYNPLFREILQRQNTITTKEHLKSWLTTKFGFQYYFKNNYSRWSNKFYLGSYVKANLGQADYWENSLGYCF